MYKRVAIFFFGWRILLSFFAFLAVILIPEFGNRFPYSERVLEITKLPNWIWGFGNFDGVHYLRIAQDGYSAQYSQAFFPMLPILIKLFASFLPKLTSLDTSIYTDPSYFYSGIILTNLFFFASLLIFYKLLRLDFNEKVSRTSLILLLVFPTSFYFGAIYTESLFLLLSVTSIYLLRKEKYFWSAALIGLATGARLIGLFLIPLYFIELYKSKVKLKLLWLLITPLGFLLYTYFLRVNFGDPFYYLTSQPIFGAGRISEGVVLLPQVIFRYIKIFLTTNVFSLAFFNALLEFTFTGVWLILLIVFFKRVRFSYWLFSFGAFILPTLTGTFSSMPRYALMGFLLLPYISQSLGRFKSLFVIISTLLLVILLSLFIRGYWVA